MGQPFRRAAALFVVVLMWGGSVAFPVDALDVTVEIYYDAAWNDITGYVFDRTAASISITRGRANESAKCMPGRMTLQLNNRDGRFSPRNPNSPLYGKIGRNTPIRISVTFSAVTYTRFVGEVSSWPSRWDVSGRDIWVPIEAFGILKRLGRGSKPLRSPLYRAMIGAASGDIVPAEYWPLEDGAQATQFASAVGGLAGIGGIETNGSQLPVAAGHSGIAGSSTSVQMRDGSLIRLPVRTYTDTGQLVVQAAFALDSLVSRARFSVLLNNGVEIFVGVNNDFSPGTQALVAEVFDAADNVVYADDAALTGGNLIDEPLSLAVAVVDTPGGDDFAAWVLDGNGDIRAQLSTTNVGYSTVRQIVALGTFSSTNFSGVGHVGLFTDPAFDPDADIVEGARAASGWDRESADDRFAHLCDQEHIGYEIVGESTALMGPERAVTRLQAMRDAEDVDQGFLGELRDALGLKFRTNSSRYDQTPVELDYAQKHITPPFEPAPDDLGIANDREVRRRNGSSARAELTEGPLSTQDPPDGVGRYDDTITVDAYADEQTDHLANWRLHIGTWDAERYPQVHIDLRRNSSLIATVAPLDSGDLLTIANLPAWLPPDDAELLVESYTETILQFAWDITFNTSPAGPYNVVGRWALISKELHAAINSAVTSIDIANTSTTQPMLATAGTDIGSGYGITIGGEDLQLTAVAASTVTYGAVGTVSHAVNASVTPGLPAGLAQGNLMLIFAAHRSGGAPLAPVGWAELRVFPAAANCQIFAKIAGASESAPTVTFTAGSATGDTSAQIIRLAGKWHSTGNILISAASCLNASAQNITVPGLAKPAADDCIIIGCGWKQDDWTSVATRSGFTEIDEPDTTTGDDHGIVWDRQIQTTATAVTATPFVITGGASAISRGAIFALRCDYQTATMTRSVNGVSASHSAGDAVTLTRPMRWGLV